MMPRMLQVIFMDYILVINKHIGGRLNMIKENYYDMVIETARNKIQDIAKNTNYLRLEQKGLLLIWLPQAI